MGMTDFSHIWLVFVFHDNTNAVVNGVVEERPAASTVAGAGRGVHAEEDGKGKGEAKWSPAREEGEGEGEGDRGGERAEGDDRWDGGEDRWGGGPREYRAPKHKLRQTFLTKVW